MLRQPGAALTSVHVPPAKMHAMNVLMSGHATDTKITNLLAGMNASVWSVRRSSTR